MLEAKRQAFERQRRNDEYAFFSIVMRLVANLYSCCCSERRRGIHNLLLLNFPLRSLDHRKPSILWISLAQLHPPTEATLSIVVGRGQSVKGLDPFQGVEHEEFGLLKVFLLVQV